MWPRNRFHIVNLTPVSCQAKCQTNEAEIKFAKRNINNLIQPSHPLSSPCGGINHEPSVLSREQACLS